MGVAATGEDRREEEGGSVLRENPIFSNDRGELTDQYPLTLAVEASIFPDAIR